MLMKTKRVIENEDDPATSDEPQEKAKRRTERVGREPSLLFSMTAHRAAELQGV